MLAIRMQRTGRKGYPTYRVIVQEAHRQPTSGKVVASIGNYNPHTKEVSVDKEKAEFYLKNGAQPSDRVVYVFESEKISLPEWVKKTSTKKQKTIKNLEKLRRNQPESEVVAEEVPVEAPEAEEPAKVDEVVAETVVAETTEAPVEDAVAEAIEDNAPEAEGKSVEAIADAEIAEGQVTAEEEVSADSEAANPSDSAEDQAEKPA